MLEFPNKKHVGHGEKEVLQEQQREGTEYGQTQGLRYFDREIEKNDM